MWQKPLPPLICGSSDNQPIETMAPPLLALRDIHLTFGGTPLLTGADLSIVAGDRVCLVGRNGSGKSTLLKIAAGATECDKGDRFLHPNAVARYLAQEADFTGYMTTLAYVEAGLRPLDDPHRAQALLYELGLTGEEDPETLSGGEARRTALAHVLVGKPDILLLDEPTNHLDLNAIEWLEAELRSLRAAIVLISHDRRFLENLSKATVWLDRGVTRRNEQGFATFETWRDEVLELEELEAHKLDRKIAREQQWMHGGVTGRRKRNVRRVALLAEMRQQKREARKVTGTVTMAASEGSTSGKLVAEALGISKSFGDVPVVNNVSLRLMRGDRLGLVGPNGAGKTTLLKMLIGELHPDSGTVRQGANLELVQLDQKRDELKPTWTVTEAMTGGKGDKVTVNGQIRHVASYMKDFLFQPEQARSPVSVLSGGERARLLLARVLAKQSNVLVLDEPTNDLDLETLDLLQELIDEYPGTVLLVSHDRDFLDRIVTSVIASEGGGHWTEYAGGYSDMIAQRKGAELASTKAALDATPQRTSTSVSSDGRQTKRKLSFKEKHALETLPSQMEKLNGDIAKLQAKMATPNLFAKDRPTFDATAVALKAAETKLAKAEEQWLELELLREELTG
jgi:ABC transport system ATP-binding/permease protein